MGRGSSDWLTWRGGGRVEGRGRVESVLAHSFHSLSIINLPSFLTDLHLFYLIFRPITLSLFSLHPPSSFLLSPSSYSLTTYFSSSYLPLSLNVPFDFFSSIIFPTIPVITHTRTHTHIFLFSLQIPPTTFSASNTCRVHARGTPPCYLPNTHSFVYLRTHAFTTTPFVLK